MLTLNHKQEKTIYTYTPFSFEEMRESLLKHKPSEIYLNAWSSKKPFLELKDYSEEGVNVSNNALSDDWYVWKSWDKFYKENKMNFYNYDHGLGMTFEPFNCYEINVVQARMLGCNNQCKECLEKQQNKNK